MAATKRIVDRAPDVVVATTAIGFRGWVEAALRSVHAHVHSHVATEPVNRA